MNPLKDIQKLAEILLSLTEGKSPKEKEKIIKDFLLVLREKNKIHLLSKILRELRKMERKREVNLFLAKKIDEEIKKKLKETIKRILGKEKEIKIKIDENIIGGFLVKSENFLIDASIKGLLNKVYGHLRTS